MAWFAGRDHASATAALIFAIGAHADPPVDITGFGQDKLTKLSQKAGAIDRDQISQTIAAGGGDLKEQISKEEALIHVGVSFAPDAPLHGARLSHALVARLE